MQDRPNTVDMALDEIIQQRRVRSRRQYRSTSGRPPAFSSRRSPPHSGGRYRPREDTSPPPSSRNLVFTVRNDDRRTSAEDGPNTILVSNLFHEVSQQDLSELFGRVGKVKAVRIHYDRAGRSNGVANVTFFNRRDALTASNRFHHMPLDGHPMQIEVPPAFPSQRDQPLPGSSSPPWGHHANRRSGRSPTHGIDKRSGFGSSSYFRPRQWRGDGPRSASFRDRDERPRRGQSPRPAPPDASSLDTDLDNYMMNQ